MKNTLKIAACALSMITVIFAGDVVIIDEQQLPTTNTTVVPGAPVKGRRPVNFAQDTADAIDRMVASYDLAATYNGMDVDE